MLKSTLKRQRDMLENKSKIRVPGEKTVRGGLKGVAGSQKPSKRAPGRKAQLHTRPRLGRCGAAGRPWAAELVVGIMRGRALRRARSG